MINTNDGYYWAEGARDILAGFHQLNDLSPVGAPISKLTAILVKIFPFSFETVIFYMPVFFGSLVAIPIVLIWKEFKNLEVGLVSALIASITWSYYNRTMAGYYDTDMLNIVFPTFLLWSLILAVKTLKYKYLVFTAIEIILYRAWYSASYSLEFSFIGLLFIYTLYLYIKKRDISYLLLLMSFMFFSMMQMDVWLKLAIVGFLYVVIKKTEIKRYIYLLFFLAIAGFFITGGFSPIWSQLKGYVFRDATKAVNDNNINLHFFSVMQTVREAGKIPFETFANRISGTVYTFILAMIGYLYLLLRYPVMLMSLPMVGLGFLAYIGGLRFTVYAVPVMAMGISYLFYEVSRFLAKFFIKNRISNLFLYLFLSVFAIFALYPNVLHVIHYKVPTVFLKNEVKVLDKLRNVAKREDYIVSWWDYGYPIRYYSDVKTLVDGGKHSGDANFPVSFILTYPQEVSAKMARLDVEYTEKRVKVSKDGKTETIRTNMEGILKEYGYKDTNEFLNNLKNPKMKLPKKTRDIYLYLPNRMLNIFPTVNLFSNIDLMTGNKYPQNFFYQTQRFKNIGKEIILGNNIKIVKTKAAIQIGRRLVPIHNFIITVYDKNGKLHSQKQILNTNAPLNVIFMKNYNKFLVLDEKMFNSTFIQLFVLENYNKELFKPIIMTPLTKVYKLEL